MIRSCDLRSFAAATIFMAFVICWVLITELIRVFTSFKLAIGYLYQNLLNQDYIHQ
jgi:hypothetical protein